MAVQISLANNVAGTGSRTVLKAAAAFETLVLSVTQGKTCEAGMWCAALERWDVVVTAQMSAAKRRQEGNWRPLALLWRLAKVVEV